MINLTITEKGGETNALSFDKDEVMIGRVQGNDIVLAKGNISKRHTKIQSAQGHLTVTDMRSTNGTYVNGRKITEPTPVKGGDKIFVGDFLIVLEPGTGATAEPPSSGARRMPGPPPPPPPPPRAAKRSGPTALSDDELGLGSDFGLPGERVPTTGGSRPSVSPPPPPRPTMAMPSLLQNGDNQVDSDGVNMGLDDAPPSLADVGAIGPDDSMGALAGDDAPPAAEPSAAVEDVFGTRPAPDEDATGGEGQPGGDLSAKASGPQSKLPDLGEREDDSKLTPPPSAATSSRKSKRLEAEPPEGGAAPTVTLDALMADPTVTAIVILPGAGVEVERAGKMEAAGELGDRNALAEAVWQLATTATPPPPGDNPVVDVRLTDGTQVTALFPPVTTSPVCAVIRKPALPEAALAELAGDGDVEKILTAALVSRRNLLLAGDAHAVSALAGALAGALPAERRVVSIGAGAKARPGWTDLTPLADPAPLVRAAVAFRAQHLLFPDLGGTELPDLLLAIARGQDGVIAAVAARSADEALGRLRAFAIGAVGEAAYPMLATTTIDLIVYAASTASGVRVIEIAEPSLEGDAVVPVFVAKRPVQSRAAQTLDVSGVSMRLGAAIAVGGDGLPPHLIRQ